jgi:hypothetical protein
MSDDDAPPEIPIDELLAEHEDDLAAPEADLESADDLPPPDTSEEPMMPTPPDTVDEALAPRAQSRLVLFGAIACAGPVYCYFVVPKQAFPYTARFVFVDSVGRRRYSGFAHWNRSEYPPTRIYARFPYPVPSGTRQVVGYWWCGEPADNDPGSPYWNYRNVTC